MHSFGRMQVVQATHLCVVAFPAVMAAASQPRLVRAAADRILCQPAPRVDCFEALALLCPLQALNGRLPVRQSQSSRHRHHQTVHRQDAQQPQFVVPSMQVAFSHGSGNSSRS